MSDYLSGRKTRRTYPKRRATPEMPRLDRVMLHAKEDASGCWAWQAYTEDGYGRLTIDGQPGLYAHRVAYEEMVGPIPDGLHLDHLCRNRSCINPYHLEPVTPLVNTRRGAGHGSEDACPQLHPYDAVNTYRYEGRRYCKTCSRIRVAEHRARKASRKEAAA